MRLWCALGIIGNVATATTPNRQALIRRGQRLEYFTIAYNSVEGLVSIVAGLIAGSVSPIGFGLDSLIEVTPGAALLWPYRLRGVRQSGRDSLCLSAPLSVPATAGVRMSRTLLGRHFSGPEFFQLLLDVGYVG